MTLLYLSALCLLLAGIYVDVVGCDMCDDGWVYHSDTASCLRVITDRFPPDITHLYDRLCRRSKGGEFRNISGNIVKFTESMELYLKDYFESVNISAAAVEVSIELRLKQRYRQIECDIYGEKQITYFVPGKRIPFKLWTSPEASVLCQVTAGPKEPPACPRDVKLVSVSDRDATISWSPGQLGRKVVVNIKVQICDGVSLSCDDLTNTTFSDVSLFQSKNYNVTGLQPNTKHKLLVRILNDKYETEDCNVTLALTTNQEYTVEAVTISRKEQGPDLFVVVVGLSVLLVICFCLCLVLATLLFRHSRQSKGDMQKMRLEVLKPKTVSHEENVHKNQDTSEGVYLNVQERSNAYDKTVVQMDDHIYEM